MNRSSLQLLSFALALAVSAPVWAQDAKSPEAAAAPAPTVPDAAAKREAARRFEHAIKLYEDADYTLALAEFERVYELVPDYRVLYNIGQVSIQLGRYARAFRTLQEYVARGKDELPAERAQAVQADLDQLAGKIATVTLAVEPAGAEISIDGSVVGTAPLTTPLVVDVGERRVEVKLAGYATGSQIVTLAGGDRRELRFSLESVTLATTPPPTPPPVVKLDASAHAPSPAASRRSWVWVGWATTGALATGAIVSGALGAAAVNDLHQLRTTATNRTELDQAHNRAATRLLIADILGGAAVVSGGVTLYLQLSSSSAKDRATARSPWHVLLAPTQVALAFEH